jgi:pimeloyl-ACP methyl ester carboxylesterase
MSIRIIVLLLISIPVQMVFSQGRKVPVEKKTILLSTGIKMRYAETGDRGKNVLILIHGYTDTGRSFYPMMNSLNNLFPDLHIFAPDLRGHGATSMPMGDRCPDAPEECFSFSYFAEDIIAFMDQMQIRQAHVAGHSMGSAIAQELALSYPARIKSVVLIGSFAKGKDNPVINDFLLASTLEGKWKDSLGKRKQFIWPQDAYTLTPLDADPDALTWMAQNWVVDPVADPAFINAIIPETARIPLGTWLGAIRNLSKFDNTVRLQKLTAPALVLWATQDNVFPETPDQNDLRKSLGQAVKAGRTTCYFKVYGKQLLPASGMQESDIGHNTHWGAPQAVAADIAAFIRTGKPTSDLPFADPKNVKRVLLEKK